MVRGELLRLPAPRAAQGREQQGARFAVVVQADELLGLSTVLVSPTSTRARAAPWRPVIDIAGTATRVITEQTRSIDAALVSDRTAGRLDFHELRDVDEALLLILGL